ncbi:MAG TPA: hypothetical protein VHF07_05120, partial [Nitrospiraceae bacterium]|nr:hypothetical protein [Nitrospiraceae bacterium]
LSCVTFHDDFRSIGLTVLTLNLHHLVFLSPTPSIQRREGYGGIEFVGRVQCIVEAIAIDGVERIVGIVSVDRISGVVRKRSEND